MNEIKTLADLKPDPQNARKHNPRNIGMIADSIAKVGLARSIVVDEDLNILAGNGTVEAAGERGLEKVRIIEADGNELIAVQRKGLTAEEKKYLALADNRTAELAGWDTEILREINLGIPELLKDMFTPLELDELLDLSDTVGFQEGEDDAPEPPEEPVTKLGDIYQLGEHRVMCGDSTDKETVGILMDGQKADMVFTDPPYNIDYQGIKDKREKIKNDNQTDQSFLNFLIGSLNGHEILYVCCSWQNAHLFKEALNRIGTPPKAMIVWDKVNPAQNLDRYYKQHELIFYHGEFGGQRTIRGDVWKLKRQQNTFHPTMKPIELIEMAILDQVGKKSIYDPFGGSGSTLIACEKLDRKCYMMEIDPAYCDVIVKRWEEFTGKKAELINLVNSVITA